MCQNWTLTSHELIDRVYLTAAQAAHSFLIPSLKRLGFQTLTAAGIMYGEM